jgi:alpha-methylacyl-CoA racemase
VDGVMQQAPAPRFSRTEPEIVGGPRVSGEDTMSVLLDGGFGEEEISSLGESGAIQL